MHNKRDQEYIENALGLARRGLGRTGQNPSVGAVIVKEQQSGQPQIIARARTGDGGTPHAETIALTAAGEYAKGATLYVTLEPCNHQGRTPPCTEAIIKAGIGRVVIASTDKDERVAGKGIERLRQAELEVVTGVLSQKADSVNAGHFLRQTENRPYITLKTAISLDGRILMGGEASETKGPVWVTSPLARRWGMLLRLEADAILIGSNTAKIDNPSLTCRLKGCEPESPVPVIIDKELSLPESLKLFQKTNQLKTIVVHASSLDREQAQTYLKSRNADLLAADCDITGRIDLNHLTEKLAEKGFTRLLVEGGGTLHKSFLEAGLVDEIRVFRGDFAVGAKGCPPFMDQPLEWAITNHGFRLNREQSILTNSMQQYVKD